jgi:hypothetical protein
MGSALASTGMSNSKTIVVGGLDLGSLSTHCERRSQRKGSPWSDIAIQA